MRGLQFPLKTLQFLAIAAALLLTAAGCHAPLLSAENASGDITRAAGEQQSEPLFKSPEQERQHRAQRPALPEGAVAAPVDDAVLLSVMDKLQQINELDPNASQKLLAELQTTPPKFWPATAEQFRASLAYRQQLAARNAVKSGPEASASGQMKVAGEERLRGEIVVAKNQEAVETQTAAPPPTAQAGFMNTALANVSGPPRQDVGPVSGPKLPPVSAAAQPAGDWHELLNRAVEDLDGRVAESPASTAEVHQHVTLRMLRLLAGQTEQALEPIPHISPREQDYWSRQIFALATYLDHHTQPDDKRRAAASAIHLEEAVANLREVGALTMRNLTVCKKVYGYGVYDPYENARYSAGQSITLYLEVENYHSRQTEKGFSTLLASSYELFDADGKRLAGDAFPDVADVCRTRRRDFHIQYSLTLPAKLAAGRYRLQLVAHDRQSDEMANASLELEVGVEAKGQ